MTFYQIKVGLVLGLVKIVPHLRLMQLEDSGMKGGNLSLADHLRCAHRCLDETGPGRARLPDGRLKIGDPTNQTPMVTTETGEAISYHLNQFNSTIVARAVSLPILTMALLPL